MGDNIYGELHNAEFHNNCSKEDDESSVNTDIPSDPWLDEEDINFGTPFQNQTTGSNNENLSFLYSSELDEDNLKQEADDLYNDLISIEDEEKRSKQQHDSELENLKREVEKLRESDTQKSMKISELMKLNTNLKKSICSLYQTVKSEIEHKDRLLAEANRKIDNILFRKNSQNFRNDKNVKNTSSNQDIDISNTSSHKRKRSTESPRSSRNEKGCESSLAKNKKSNLVSDRSEKCVPDRNHCNSETFKFSDNSRDLTETNTLFFNLMPTPLKKAFHEYEQNQIVSLNRLKQSFINDYFSSNKSTPSNLGYNPKRARLQSTFLGNQIDTVSKHCGNTVMSNKSSDEMNCKITRSNQKDLVSLFKYKKEKIPFLEKRKFGLLKEGKDLVPENLL